MDHDQQRFVTWLQNYVYNREVDEYLKIADRKSLEYVAEATYYCVEHGLDKLLSEYTMYQIRRFCPWEDFRLNTPDSSSYHRLLYTVVNSMSRRMPGDLFAWQVQYALGQAAHLFYIKKHGIPKHKEETRKYEDKY